MGPSEKWLQLYPSYDIDIHVTHVYVYISVCATLTKVIFQLNRVVNPVVAGDHHHSWWRISPLLCTKRHFLDLITVWASRSSYFFFQPARYNFPLLFSGT